MDGIRGKLERRALVALVGSLTDVVAVIVVLGQPAFVPSLFEHDPSPREGLGLVQRGAVVFIRRILVWGRQPAAGGPVQAWTRTR